MTERSNVSHWIDRVKTGDSEASERLWNHYYERLVKAARAKLQGQNRGPSDEEDIAVSVFESFYRAAGKGRFSDLFGRDDLWRLLLKMSARKIVDRRRRDATQKRGEGARILSLDAKKTSHGDDGLILEVIGDDPSPEMVASMTESFQRILDHLGDGQLQQIAVGKMEGYSNAELAQRFDCSERTIERRLNLIREKCLQELLNDDPA